MSVAKYVGFWREDFPSASGLPLLLEEPRYSWDDTELAGLCLYLEKGATLVASPGIRRSFIDQKEIAGSSSIRTDGLWIWPSTLPYYLRKAKPPLPDEFRKRVKGYNYVPPTIDAATLASIEVPF